MSQDQQQQNDGQQPQYKMYKPQVYKDRQQPSNKAVANKQLVANMTIDQLKRHLADVALQERNALKQSGIATDPKTLVQEYLANNPVVVQAVREYEEAKGFGVTPMEAGISYYQNQAAKNRTFDAENELIAEKFKFTPSRENLQKFIQAYGIPNISRKKLEELMVIDDWASILSNILPAVKRGAFNAIDWAHQTYVKPNLEETNIEEELQQLKRQQEIEKKRLELEVQKQKAKKEIEQLKSQLQDEFTKEDWGQIPIDQGRDPTTQMWKMARVPGQTYEGIPRATFQHSPSNRLVDIAYIRSVLCPEYYSAKSPLPGYAPCMTIQSSVNYNVVTTDTGSQVCVLNPWNALAAATGVTDIRSGWYFQNATAFNTDTGTYTGLAVYDGPLVPINGDLSCYRIQSASIAFVPTLSENNAQGSVSLCQYNNFSQADMLGGVPGGTAPQATNQAMSSNTMYVSGNIRSVYRQVLTPGILVNQGFWSATAVPTINSLFNNQFVLTIGGAPPSTVAGKIYVYFNIEVRYKPTATRFVAQQPSQYSPDTIELVQSLCTHESLFMQSANDIRKPLLTTFNTDFVPTFENVYNLLISHAKNFKGKSVYEQPTTNMTYDQSNSSFIVE